MLFLHRSPQKRTRRGFSLVEVTLALGVAGFCLVSIFGLIPVALNSNQAALEQTVASGILTSISGDLRAAAKSATASEQFGITLPPSPGTPQTLFFDGDRKQVATANLARYRVTISSFSASATAPVTATCANVRVSWPAGADPANTRPAGSVKTFIAVDRS